MDYFIGKGIDAQLTGIERAQMNRLELFKKMARPAKIVRFTYTSHAHTDAARFGVTDADMCNMFDWYQHAEHVPIKTVTPASVAPVGATLQAGGQVGETVAVNCVVASKVVAQIRYDKATNRVNFVLWTDDAGRVKETDSYDSRGFLAVRNLINPAGQMVAAEYLTPAGEVALTIHYDVGVKPRIHDITLADGQQFENEEALKENFIQGLDRQEPSRFFFDRDYNQAMLTQLPLQGPKFVMIHNNIRTYDRVMKQNQAKVLNELGINVKAKKPKESVAAFLNQLGDVSGVIAPTAREAADLRIDYPEMPPIYIVPAGVSVTQPERVDFAERNPEELIVVARISPEKGIGDSVDVLLQLHHKFPNAHLSVYGLAGGTVAEAYLARMNKLILKEGAANAVAFMGFRDNLDDAYNHAGMMLVTSSTEAFPTSIQEALAHGLPVISYDVAYGPADMITDGENGRLVPTGDKDAMVDVISMLLRHPDQLHLLSNGAYRLRKKYGARAVWAQYQQLPETKN